MRPKNMETSLGELMGSGSKQSMKLDNLHEFLGDKMQEMPRNSVGRFRLIKSLQQRFGNGFRNIPGVSGVIKEFDDEVKFSGVLDSMKAVKIKRSE